MVIRQPAVFGFATPKRRMSPRTSLIVAVSLGLHGLVAAYLAMMQFAPPKAEITPPDKPIDLSFYTPPKAPPPPPPKAPRPLSAAPRPPAPTDFP